MYQRLPKKACFTHKLVRRIMLRQKFGKINHMIANQIFGPWDVSFMK